MEDGRGEDRQGWGTISSPLGGGSDVKTGLYAWEGFQGRAHGRARQGLGVYFVFTSQCWAEPRGAAKGRRRKQGEFLDGADASQASRESSDIVGFAPDLDGASYVHPPGPAV